MSHPVPPTWQDGPRHGPLLRHRWAGGPLRRDPAAGLAGGVVAGFACRRGINVTTVRVLLTVFTLFTGFPLIVYVAFWLFLPAKDEANSIFARARSDSLGLALAAGVASVVAVFMVIAGSLSGWRSSWTFPVIVAAGGLVLIWRNASAEERARLRRMVAPLEATATSGGLNKRSLARVAVSVAMVAGGVAWGLSGHESLAMLRPLAGGALVLAATVLLLGPWWLRIARDLVLERQARARAEERAEVAARVHDSVLQTLALIQRRASDPQQVVQLARVQERELRSLLFGGNEAEASFAARVRAIQQDVEDRYGLPVEAVTVGDCELDGCLEALLAAAREATVNAAKWSGASVISLFAEVEPAQVSVAVRDRGKGFDPEAVPADRKGLAESVRGRMSRHGGTATVQSAVGEGTKVTVTMPRTPRSQARVSA
jgi:signal transduction histidine kinase